MDALITHIVKENEHLLLRMAKEIEFGVDHEGKRIINLQTQQLYRGKLKRDQLIEIVLRSVVAIRKMSQLKDCGWSIGELEERLITSLEYYSEKFDVDLESLFMMRMAKGVQFAEDINDKFPAKFRAIDGHYVRSKSELLIDNLLFSHNIVHAYEKKLPGQQFLYSDFYLPPGKDHSLPIYIEYWGYSGEKYQKRRSDKLNVYRALELNLVEIFDEDVQQLHEILAEKLRKFNISLE